MAAAGPMTLADYGALAAYAALVLYVGARVSRGRLGAGELLLAGRRLPTAAVLGSTVATELSAATFIGVPHAAYLGDWAYLQLAVGALAAKLLLAARAIPLYHRMGVVTVYGVLDPRYGPRARRTAALCFAAGRILASGVRLFIAGLAFAAVAGVRVETAIVACGLIASAYTLWGGLRAVVWTDALQGVVFLAAAAATLAAIGAHADGGLAEILAWGAERGRLQLFHLDPAIGLSDSTPFLVALVGGFFLTLATHGTDHDMVQRLLGARDGRSGGRALVYSALANVPITALFLLIGTGLAYVYATPPGYDLGDGSRAFPLFVLHELPSGLRGLVFAGLFAAAMSSLDSAACAVSAAWTEDVRPRSGGGAGHARRVRGASAVSCALLIGAALAMASYHRALAAGAGDGGPALSLVELALSAMTILYGGLLGVFALAMASRRRGGDASAVAGLAAGGLTGLALFLHPIALGETLIAWPWWVPIGAAVAFAVAALGRPTPARATG